MQDQHPPSLDIQQMIIAEGDPRQRASLIVLHAISLSLEANTATVREISLKLEKHLVRFDNHATKEQELMNQGRGAWKVIAGVLTFAQAMVLLGLNAIHSGWKEEAAKTNSVITEIKAVALEQQASRSAMSELRGRIGILEQRP